MRGARLYAIAYAILLCFHCCFARKDLTAFKFFSSDWEFYKVNPERLESLQDEGSMATLQLSKDVDLSLVYGNLTILQTEASPRVIPLRMKFKSQKSARLMAMFEIPSNVTLDWLSEESVVYYEPIGQFVFEEMAPTQFYSHSIVDMFGQKYPVQILMQGPNTFVVNVFSTSLESKHLTYVAFKSQAFEIDGLFDRFGIYIVLVIALLGTKLVKSHYKDRANLFFSKVDRAQYLKVAAARKA
eukprot:TRINITY_DN6373_c0_g1_i5.p1 TRINITY_DN6373_c0_g1~~TRINITY_DN6373_c0_g1_i5.p1  ORF type:complete len:242 (+),score=58.05 TRINITY_DN6373_c0_g1_i5:60-785(+)